MAGLNCARRLSGKETLTLPETTMIGALSRYISDETVIKEFSENYWLEKNENGCAYSEDGCFCVLVRYSEFMKDPEKYIEKAFQKLNKPICQKVHWRDLREKVY